VTLRVPDGFRWGTATSAYQIEGAATEDGRGESVWDRYSHTPGRIADASTGDVACDHYHRWSEEVDLLAALGVGLYRLSVGWPRILPTGSGRPEPRGIAFYERLVDRLLERGIEPLVTLDHWDMPQALQDAGGWPERDTASRFVEYAEVVFRALGDRVAWWATHNEPWMVAAIGHRLGLHAPGVKSFDASLRAAHHLLLSHGMAVDLHRDMGLHAPIGIVLNLFQTVPHRPTDEDRREVVASDGYTNRWFLDPLHRGRYPEDTWVLFEHVGGTMDFVKPGDLDVIARPTDYLGVNFYGPRVVRAAAPGETSEFGWVVERPAPGHPVTDAGWEISGDAFRDLLVRLQREYGPRPLLVTENGAIRDDAPDEHGEVRDPERIGYLHAHLRAAWQAIQEGVDLRGYCAWSLLDNWEWADGYTKRFGLVYVDYETQRRIPKASYGWYRSVIAEHGVPDSEPDLGRWSHGTGGTTEPPA
jgi:beta-glucosidase